MELRMFVRIFFGLSLLVSHFIVMGLEIIEVKSRWYNFFVMVRSCCIGYCGTVIIVLGFQGA